MSIVREYRMKQVGLRYGRGRVEVGVPDSADVLTCPHGAAVADPEMAVGEVPWCA